MTKPESFHLSSSCNREVITRLWKRPVRILPLQTSFDGGLELPYLNSGFYSLDQKGSLYLFVRDVVPSLQHECFHHQENLLVRSSFVVVFEKRFKDRYEIVRVYAQENLAELVSIRDAFLVLILQEVPLAL